MNDGLKVLGITAGAAVMIACCVALSVGPFVVLGAISGLWAWLGGCNPVLGAGGALVVAAVGYGVVRGRNRSARACDTSLPDAPTKIDRA